MAARPARTRPIAALLAAVALAAAFAGRADAGMKGATSFRDGGVSGPAEAWPPAAVAGVAGEPAEGYVRYRNVMVEMVSVPGVKLGTEVYLPAAAPPGGKTSTLMIRTPYNKDAKNPELYAAYFVAKLGYALVIQDVRGRYTSEGSFTKYVNEGPDGFDTVAWIAAQAWSNEKVGSFGTSYLAHVQMAAACMQPPALKCMWLDEGGFNSAYESGVRQGGAFELKQATWAFAKAVDSLREKGGKDYEEILKTDLKSWFSPDRMPWTPGKSPMSLAPDYESYLLDQWYHGTFDEYWTQTGIYARKCYKDLGGMKIHHMSGWYDPYALTASENYIGLTKVARNEGKPNGNRLVLGAWMHGEAAHDKTSCGDVDFGPDATLSGNLCSSLFDMIAAWFQDCGIAPGAGLNAPGAGLNAPGAGPNGGADAPSAGLNAPGATCELRREEPVSVFVMGGGSGGVTGGKLSHGGAWRHFADWPPPAEVTRLYLTADKGLVTASPTGADLSLAYSFDPLNPVPSIGGTITSGAPIMEGGAFDQIASERFFPPTSPAQALTDRSDVLTFLSEPLDKDVTVIGKISARLFVTSDCVDTDFTVKLVDQYPPSDSNPRGFAMNLVDGILRARYRNNGWSKPELMTPGTTYEVEVETFPVANTFKAGHRIRLDVSSSNYPHFDINSNTGAEYSSTDKKVARNFIYMDAERPSALILPVVV